MEDVKIVENNNMGPNIRSKPKSLVHRIIFEHVPLVGSASYVSFSVYVMHSRLFKDLFGVRDAMVSNILWFNAQLGIGLYTFNRPHLAKFSSSDRIMYSIFTTIMFNFGSTLVWAMAKERLGLNLNGKLMFGAISSIGFLYMGRDYLRALDSL